MSDELITNKHEIVFKSTAPIRMGGVFYAIEELYQNFFGACPVCDGERKFTIKGYTFDCPKCHGVHSGALVLSVRSYRVIRFRVRSISEEMCMSSWDSKHGFSKSVTVRLFRPAPRGNYFECNKECKCNSTFTRDGWKIDLSEAYDRRPLYSDYKVAVAEADRLNAEQEAIVVKYNEDHGTHYVFEKPEYDLKSR